MRGMFAVADDSVTFARGLACSEQYAVEEFVRMPHHGRILMHPATA